MKARNCLHVARAASRAFAQAATITAFFLITGVLASGCGYHLQRSGEESVLTRKGIRRIYLQPLGNQSYKPGVDHVVYNELLRSIAGFDRIRVVRTIEEADAILRGTVAQASYSASAATFANNIFPPGVGGSDIPVATEYTASLLCSFMLVQIEKPSKAEKTIWASSFARSRPFPANNQLGPFGTTSALINESEFDRALRDMAESMMADVNEAMFAMF